MNNIEQNILKKMEEWTEVKEDDRSNIITIFKKDGKWFCIDRETSYPVVSLFIATDYNDSPIIRENYNINSPNTSNFDGYLMIRNRSKLLAEFSNGELFAFGLKNISSGIKKIYINIYIQFEDMLYITTITGGYNNSNKVTVTEEHFTYPINKATSNPPQLNQYLRSTAERKNEYGIF